MAALAVIGGGPAGLAAAEHLAAAGHQVTVYDRMPSLGRKFLLAGRGGLNLTHSEPLERLLTRYGAAPLAEAIRSFPPDALRAWAEALSQPTFIGTSGRVFPVAFKATPLLRAWLGRLGKLGVQFRAGHRWTGWDDSGALHFDTPAGPAQARPDATILALGGASWPRLGSDGAWVQTMENAGIAVAPLRPANGGFLSTWSDTFRTRFAGEPLKRIAATFAGTTIRGEAMLTADGIEGGLIYAFSAPLRDAIDRDGEATLTLDLRPDLDRGALSARMGGRGVSTSNALRRAGLTPAAAALTREPGTDLPLIERVKALPLRLTGAKPIARAISTAGGLRFGSLDGLMLTTRPGTFIAGEMLDWEAPTGGYLLQACFSTGHAAAAQALAWLRAPEGHPRA